MPYAQNLLALVNDDSTRPGLGAVYLDGLFTIDDQSGAAFDAAPSIINLFSASFDGVVALPYATVVLLHDGGIYATTPVSGTPFRLPPHGVVAAGSDLVALGSVALFVGVQASPSQTVVSLWRTDGTVAGTVELQLPQLASNSAGQTQIMGTVGTGAGLRAVFSAYGADGVNALWASDGTAGGTVRLGSLPASDGTGSHQLAPIGSLGPDLLLSAFGNVIATDGTAGGTRTLGSATAAGPGALTSGRLVFATSDGRVLSADGNALTLVATPPTSAGVYQSTFDFVSVGGLVYFIESPNSASSYTSSIQVTDGTAAGTSTLVLPTVNGTPVYANGLTPYGKGFLFTVPPTASTPGSVWFSDGTTVGTTELHTGGRVTSVVVQAGLAYFGDNTATAGTGDIYQTDGTVAGTRLLSATAADNLATDPTRVATTGSSGQYRLIANAAGGVTIADNVANRDGTATFDQARVVAFTDGTGVLDPTGNGEAVARIYEAAFGRAPDAGGLTGYTAQLDAGTASLAGIAAGAAVSPEFLSGGTLSDSAFVTRLYQDAAGRTPDAAGLAGYVGALAHGTSRGSVLLDIAEGAEARAHSVGVAGQANDAEVTRLYEAVLGRAPDAGGRTGYSADLASGATPQQLAAAMLASAEYGGKYGTPSNAEFTADLYRNLLLRAPDSAGLAGYTAALAAGASRAGVVAAFAGGDEGRLVTAGATHDGWVHLG